VSGIPTAWVKRMQESMARLTPHFSANRAVREYTGQHYLPAANAYRLRGANNGAIARQMVDWQHILAKKWAALRFGDAKVALKGGQHVFEVQVYLDGLEPDLVRVELYAEGVNGDGPVRMEMALGQKLPGAEEGYVYGAQVPATRAATDYTARVIPHRSGVAVPLEAAQILWQR
jgi:starch phosphorylase